MKIIKAEEKVRIVLIDMLAITPLLIYDGPYPNHKESSELQEKGTKCMMGALSIYYYVNPVYIYINIIICINMYTFRHVFSLFSSDKNFTNLFVFHLFHLILVTCFNLVPSQLSWAILTGHTDFRVFKVTSGAGHETVRVTSLVKKQPHFKGEIMQSYPTVVLQIPFQEV